MRLESRDRNPNVVRNGEIRMNNAMDERLPVRLAALAAVAVSLSGCASVGPTPTEPPSPMSLREGVQAVMAALDELAQRPADAPIHGLMPAEVEVVFQIRGQRADSDSFELTVGVPEFIGAGTERSTEVTRSEGNTLTIRFRSIVFAPQEQLIGVKSAEELTDLVKDLRGRGWATPSR